MKAIWNDTVIAESNETKLVENNHYFPQEAVKKEFLKPSNKKTRCPWKGEAFYYTVEVDGIEHKDAAWYYPKTSYAAKPIENYVAFWRDVKVTE